LLLLPRTKINVKPIKIRIIGQIYTNKFTSTKLFTNKNIPRKTKNTEVPQAFFSKTISPMTINNIGYQLLQSVDKSMTSIRFKMRKIPTNTRMIPIHVFLYMCFLLIFLIISIITFILLTLYSLEEILSFYLIRYNSK